MVRSDDDWTRVEAAHALWRVMGDPVEPMTVPAEAAGPPAGGDCLPVRIVALRHLAAIGVATEDVTTLARAVVDNPRRIAYFGGWRTFTEEEEIRAAVRCLMGRRYRHDFCP